MPVTKIARSRAPDENSSYNFLLYVYKVNADGSRTALTPDTVKVYVILPDSTPVQYINNRDGTVATGLTTDANEITFHMAAADNPIAERDTHAIDGYENHLVRFEITYNGGVDTHYEEFLLPVRDLHAIGS
jgi:hypothetical protein